MILNDSGSTWIGFARLPSEKGGFPSISLGAEETEGTVDGMHLMVEAMQNKIFFTSYWLHQPVEDCWRCDPFYHFAIYSPSKVLHIKPPRVARWKAFAWWVGSAKVPVESLQNCSFVRATGPVG